MPRKAIPPYEKARRIRGNRRGEDPRHVTLVAERLGKAIKEARISRGLTQNDLAMLIDSSISTVVQYERGDRTPSLVAMLRLAKACQTSLSSIYSVLDGYRLPPLPPLLEDPPKPPLRAKKWT